MKVDFVNKKLGKMAMTDSREQDATMGKAFNEKGFETLKIFDDNELRDFLLVFECLLDLQMRKLDLKKSKDIYSNVSILNKRSSVALSEVLSMARNTSIGHKLASNPKIQSYANALFNNAPNDEKKLLVSGPSFFLNMPDNVERKYTWHSEQNWYPKRRKFLNIWCPVFNDRTNDDSMAVMPSSHKKDWFYFSEYTGYDGKMDDTANIQYEIPSAFLKEYKSYIPSVKVGEGLFFDGKLVHRSLDNISKKPQFAIVFRVFDYSDDLTLSADWADIPYNRKSVGIPEINVNP